MSTQSDNTIIDEQYLLTVLNLSPAFIARHSRSMGCFARKPRRFFLTQVLTHLQFLAADAQARAQGRKFSKATQIRDVRRFADKITRKKQITDAPVGDFAAYFERQYGAVR